MEGGSTLSTETTEVLFDNCDEVFQSGFFGGTNRDPLEPSTQSTDLFRFQAIRLVQEHQARHGIQVEFGQQRVNSLDFAFQALVRGIDDMQQEVCVLKLLEGRSERIHQVFWKIVKKPHRIGNDDFSFLGKPESSRSWVQRHEESVG